MGQALFHFADENNDVLVHLQQSEVLYITHSLTHSKNHTSIGAHEMERACMINVCEIN